jgi:MATE family multidrug resistance protein
VALLHVSDAMQTVSIFVLRCYRVTLAPFAVYCVLLWGVGLGGGYLLAYRGLGPWPAQMSPAAFWQAAAGGLLVTALAVRWLLGWVSRRVVAQAA